MHPKASSVEVQQVLNPNSYTIDEKEYDRDRKARKRAKGREIYIPLPADLTRRQECLNNNELLLNTYFPVIYDEEFTQDRTDMLGSITRAAMYAGDQSIAAPRGEGKTTLALDGALCSMLSELSTFPVVIGKNQESACEELKAFREKLAASELFVADFPEIGVPLEAVGESTQNARLLTVGGKFIRLHLGKKFFAFPTITIDQLPEWKARGIRPISCGQIMGALGIGGKIRGCKFRNKRPTLALIDDIEDEKAANSDKLIEKHEKIIEKDIAGLSRSAKRIARVMLCTTWNRKCIAYKFTDPKQKPSWKGRRYRKMIKPPTNMKLVDEYILKRQMKGADDPEAREAFRFWKANKTEIEEGCIISNHRSFNSDLHEDEDPIELSAIQAYYNRVADTSPEDVATEIDNDPPPEVGPQDSGITAAIVASRDSGLEKRQIPLGCTALTAGFDLGKRYIHWVIIAWLPGGTGIVTDYGYVNVLRQEPDANGELADPLNVPSDDIEEVATLNSIYFALLNLRDIISAKIFTDQDANIRRIDKIFVDSGTFTTAAYEFCRQVRGPYYPSKGQSPFHRKTEKTDNILPGTNVYASKQTSEQVWLYNVDADYWKTFVHEGFLTPTFDEKNMLRRGSLSLYHSEKSLHRQYAPSIVGKMYLSQFIEGKGLVAKWTAVKEDDHFLDATAYASAAGEACGIKLLQRPPEEQLAPVHKEAVKPAVRPRPQHGSNVRRVPGGWMNRVRR